MGAISEAKAALAYLLADRFGIVRGGGPYRMAMRRRGGGVDFIVQRPDGSRVRHRVRGDTSDAQVMLDVFHHRSYDTSGFRQHAALMSAYHAIVAQGAVPLIVDAGANIGAATLYYRDCFPAAAIVAVEPEAGNFAELARHVGSDALTMPLRAALSDSDGALAVVDAGLDSWGFRTAAAVGGANEIPALSVPSVVARAAERWNAVPFILKCDIEGFEETVFAGDTGWIDHFALVIVELHDWMLPGQGSSRPVTRALAARDRDFLIKGENVFSFRNGG
jgi:FkbM family methyltransferase